MTNGGKIIAFSYDHNGLRTRKSVTKNEITTTYDYTVHGKLVMSLTKKTGNEPAERLHFYYDKDSRSRLMEYTDGNGDKNVYSYIHNLQGDIVGKSQAFAPHLTFWRNMPTIIY